MTNVTEHHSKEEGKGDTGKESWIDFLVLRYVVLISHQLEDACELVSEEEGRWRNVTVVRRFKLDDSWHIKINGIGCFQVTHDIQESCNVTRWYPSESHDDSSVVNLHLVEGHTDLFFPLQVERVKDEEIDFAIRMITCFVVICCYMLDVNEVLAEPQPSDLKQAD